MTNTSFINRSILLKNIHTVEITNIYMYFTLLSRSVPKWFVRQFDCHWLEGPVKLIKRVKIAHSFLQSVSNEFHVIILSFAM